MIAVILFLSRFATRFLRTIDLIENFSKNSRKCVRVTSNARWNLRAKIVKPKMMPKRINRKICEISLILNESNEKGINWYKMIP